MQNVVATGAASVSLDNLENYGNEATSSSVASTDSSKRKALWNVKTPPTPKRQNIETPKALLRLLAAMEHRTQASRSKLELAIELLENEFSDVLDSCQFIRAIELLEQPLKATILVALKNKKKRDEWLEDTLNIMIGAPE